MMTTKLASRCQAKVRNQLKALKLLANWVFGRLKWHSYPPHPEAVYFDEFLAVVDEDENCCFWG